MPSKTEDLAEEPPTNINPYSVLELDPNSNPSDIKTAYKKLALKHHPDKAPPSARPAAHTKFQEIAFAYAILSDPRRRKRYDTTGNASESLSLSADDDSFNWTDFFRAQYADIITAATLNDLKSTYQGSDDEVRDVLAAYKAGKGELRHVFSEVMLSNPLDDEDRFRSIIDTAISNGEVKPYDAYVKEPASAREKRHAAARKEAVEAEEYAKELGVHEQLFGDGNGNGKGDKSSGGGKKGGKNNTNKSKKDDEAALAALIQQRSQSRAATFLDDLEAKYAKPKNRGKKRAVEEDDEEGPSEEAFQKMADRTKKHKAAGRREKSAEEEEEEERAEGGRDAAGADEAEEEEEEEKTTPKPRTRKEKNKKGIATQKAGRKPRTVKR
ncbi:hypothetical protein MMC24_001189 [Lignoscripta atroalba]|nr:hypothetical protein [Lignoscripta atroalba]